MRKDTLGLIQEAMDFMEENLKSEIEISEMSKRAGYSEYHFCQLFQMATGLSVKQYMVCRRLKHGLYEISKGAKKQEVAFSYGFDTYAGFYKAFYREYGMSPSEYLKVYRPSFPYRVNLLQEGKVMISKKFMEKLLAHWGMEQSPVTNVVYEGSNQVSENEFQVGEDFVLKVSGLPGGLKRHMEIAGKLDKVGLQASVPVATKTGELLVQEGEVYAVLCKRVQGTKMSGREMFTACDTKAAYRFGTLIGKLHLALANLDAGLFAENRLHDTVQDWALPTAQKKINLLQELVAEYKNRFCDVYDKLPKQIIHRNMNLSYVYVNGEEMVGVTDFELSEYSIRLFDVCYAATGILSENFTDNDETMEKWLLLFENIVKGYDEVMKLTEEEKQALPYVVFSIQLICVAYFADKEEFAELAKVNEKMLTRLMEHKEELLYCE
ncbi:MAG: helix-turn-helix domain-containing protein [Lachnospiraceae bacterium]|nr:helix-turn-helix domain-containing protein [Lachnospiraceae bacterium]